jgi:hypothetical protein
VESIPNVAASFGLGPTTELALALPVVRYIAPKTSAKTGIGDASAGIKHRFWKGESGLSVGGSSQVSFPTGNGQIGTGAGGFGLNLSLIGQWEIGAWKNTGQFKTGRTMKAGEPVTYLYGFTFARSFEKFFLGLQTYVSSYRRGNRRRRDFFAGIGCGFRISDRISGQFEWSKGLTAGGGDLAVYGGLTADFSFGKAE